MHLTCKPAVHVQQSLPPAFLGRWSPYPFLQKEPLGGCCLSQAGLSCCFPAAGSCAAWLWTVLLHVLRHLLCLLGLQPPRSRLLCSCRPGACCSTSWANPTWGQRQREHHFSTRALAAVQGLTGGLAIPLQTSCGSEGIVRRLLDAQTCVDATSFFRCVTGAKSDTVLTLHCHFMSHHVG